MKGSTCGIPTCIKPCQIFNLGSEVQYEHGYKLGLVDGEDVYLNNHLAINLKYNKLEGEEGISYRIVAFEVVPHSVAAVNPGTDNSCSINTNDNHLKLDSATKQITFSYSGQFL